MNTEDNMNKYHQMLEILQICKDKNYFNETKTFNDMKFETDRAEACNLLLHYKLAYKGDLSTSFQSQLEDLFVETSDFKDLEVPMRNLCKFDYSKWREK